MGVFWETEALRGLANRTGAMATTIWLLFPHFSGCLSFSWPTATRGIGAPGLVLQGVLMGRNWGQ